MVSEQIQSSQSVECAPVVRDSPGLGKPLTLPKYEKKTRQLLDGDSDCLQ